MLSLIALSSALLSATYVSAHGFVSNVQIGGTSYPGWDPNTDPYFGPVDRIVRKIPDDGPIEDAYSPDLACNTGGADGANTVADINAGGDISFTWNVWPDDHKGPITIMMADCNGDCTTFSANGAKWFKIDQMGYSNGQWATDKMIAQGKTWTSTIPSELSNGQYLVRMDIVALHSTGNPQWYPSCAQVNVKNGGGKTPSGNDLANIPGIYEGFEWIDIWGTGDFAKFKVAGPSVVSFAASSGGSGQGSSGNDEESSSSSEYTSTSRSAANNGSNQTPTITSDAPAETADSEPSSTGSCRRRKRSTSLKSKRLHQKRGSHFDRLARHASH